MPRDHDSYDFKVVITGDSGVGKTSLHIRYRDDTFEEMHHGTIGVEYMSKTIPLDGKVVKLALWDTAGQERFGALATSFYRGSSGVIIVYDITNQLSFESMHRWVKAADNWANADVCKLLIGNKCDMEGDRVVEYNTAKDYADQLGIPYIETSAKDGMNVEQAYVIIAAAMKTKTDVLKSVDSKDRVKLSNKTTAYSVCC